MLVCEILLKKRYLDKKLTTINSYIDVINNSSLSNTKQLLDVALNYKFELLSKIRSYSITLDKLNKETYISVDGVELSIYEALYVLKTLELKMQTLSDVVVSKASLFIDATDFLSKNDNLFNEYQKIYIAIQNSDVCTSWEGK